MSSDKFDPKLWEGWETCGGSGRTKRRKYSLPSCKRVVDVSLIHTLGEPVFCVYVQETLIAEKNTQEKALEIANAIGGWE